MSDETAAPASKVEAVLQQTQHPLAAQEVSAAAVAGVLASVEATIAWAKKSHEKVQAEGVNTNVSLALAELIPALQDALDDFRERTKL